jgi:hypothetical protein
MQRQFKTAEEIQAEVDRLIHQGDEVKEDKVKITVPLPTPLAEGVTEENGSNWTMDYFRNCKGYEGWVLHVVSNVQSKWSLQR